MSALYDFTFKPSVEPAVMVAALVDAYTSKRAFARALGVREKNVLYWERGGVPQHRHLDRITEFYEHLTAWETA